MKTTKVRSTAAFEPVWCHRCYIRIAPYATRTTYHGKSYHRDCYTKMTHEKAQARKN